MKRSLKVLLIVVVLVFLIPHGVSADDYISNAVDALQTTTVYVAPGTPGTDDNTSGKLQAMLKSSDNIVLVMLPEEALSGTDIYSIAKSLSDKLEISVRSGLPLAKKL